MKTLRASIILLSIAALSGAAFAGQSNKEGKQGKGAEPECDYIAVPAYL